MADPVVGSGESHGNSVRDGMRRANEQRDKWLTSLKRGEVNFKHVVDLSKNEQHKSLGRIRLADILAGRPGWTEMTALEAMNHQGFSPKDTIQSIRRSERRVELFSVLTQADSDRWRPRPLMPEGWPWFGKLSALVSQDDVEAPDELAEFLGMGDEEEIMEEAPGHDPLADLLSCEGDD